MTLLGIFGIIALMAGLGGNGELVGIGVMFLLVVGMYVIREAGVSNYNPPNGIDHDKLNRDAMNGANANTLKNNMLNGKYDKK